MNAKASQPCPKGRQPAMPLPPPPPLPPGRAYISKEDIVRIVDYAMEKAQSAHKMIQAAKTEDELLEAICIYINDILAVDKSQ